MREERYDGGKMRAVLAGMVTDRTVLAKVSRVWRPEGLFDAPWANLVGGWCVEHMARYKQPPDKLIGQIFSRWKEKGDDKQAELVGRFLDFVSREWAASPITTDYLLDMADEYFNDVQARRVAEQVAEVRGREAIDAMHRADRIDLRSGSSSDPTTDWDAWEQVFDTERRKPIVAYQKGLGKFFGSAFSRESFIAFMAPDKSFKSWWLLDVAAMALRDRRRVFYVEAGDLLRDRFWARMAQRTASRPLFPCSVAWPTGFDDKGVPVVEKREFEEEMDSSAAMAACRKITRNRREPIYVSCHSNSTLSVDGLRSILGDHERRGWVPDVVVIDYADIMASPKGFRDSLDQIDENWKQLRRLSQDLHCLVVTATQSNASAYGNKGAVEGRRSVLKKHHFSGRKTKLAHVDGMIGINVDPDERERGVCRLNWVVRRDSRYNEERVVTVAGCYECGRPAVVSSF